MKKKESVHGLETSLARKGGTMKTTALWVLLMLGVVSASGCHWLHHRDNNNYSNTSRWR